MDWYRSPLTGQPQLTKCAGFALCLPTGRVGIGLNGMRLLLDLRASVDKIVATVVHEMLVSSVQSVHVIYNRVTEPRIARLLLPPCPHRQKRRLPRSQFPAMR